MNTKDNQRTRITKMIMKQAYLDLMMTKPVSKITVKEICEKSQINRSTFYIHYDEPNSILMELEDETIVSLVSYLNAIGASDKNEVSAKNYLVEFLKYIRKNDDLFRALLIKNSDPHFLMKMQAVALNIVENTFDVDMTKEIQNSVYLFLVNGSIAVIKNWIETNYDLSETPMSNILYSLCEGSIRDFSIEN